MFYKCDDCKKIYTTKKSLRRHIEIKHSTAQSLQCVKCDKYFLNKYSLKSHVHEVHPSKLHSCTFCGSSFKASLVHYEIIVGSMVH
jgi:uncharacterized C2H2 Zn-finger protein